MPDFARRTLTPELMDTEDCGFETFRACLVDLAAANRLTLAYRPTVDFFDRLARAGRFPAGRPLRVLDVGAGYGDMLRVLDRWAQRRGLALDLTGADLNPFAARAAGDVTDASRPIRWITANALSLPGEPPDVVISSLFTHHLDDDQLIHFLTWSEATARIGWFVNDLHRHAFSLYGFGLLARLMRWHRFVIHDGPVSIARAFEAGDWRDLLREAGLPKGAGEGGLALPLQALRRAGEALSDAVVIGGGPAGAALAAELAYAGRDVTVYEREAEATHKVCGEFLSVEACGYLAALGIDLPALGAVPIDTVRLWRGRRSVSAALPFRAMSLSRKALDEALLTRAGDLGAKVRRGVRVTGLNKGLRDWRVRLDGSVEASAGDVFLAVGKHDLKGWRRPPGAQSDLVGFKMHWRLTPGETAALRGVVELFLFPGGYAGLELVEEGAANLCALVRRHRVKALGGWDEVLAAMSAACPALAERLAGAEPLWPRPLAVAGLPYGHVQSGGGGPWRIGDQGAVIPSFAGDGLAIALHSARLAARTYLRGGAAEAYHDALSRDLSAQMSRAVWLSRAMVRPWSQGLLAAMARANPRLLTATARATRISPGALAEAPRARALRPLPTS